MSELRNNDCLDEGVGWEKVVLAAEEPTGNLSAFGDRPPKAGVLLAAHELPFCSEHTSHSEKRPKSVVAQIPLNSRNPP